MAFIFLPPWNYVLVMALLVFKLFNCHSFKSFILEFLLRLGTCCVYLLLYFFYFSATDDDDDDGIT